MYILKLNQIRASLQELWAIEEKTRNSTPDDVIISNFFLDHLFVII